MFMKSVYNPRSSLQDILPAEAPRALFKLQVSG